MNKEESKMKIEDLIKYCKLCPRNSYCNEYASKQQLIECCLLNSGIRIGCQQTIKDIQQKNKEDWSEIDSAMLKEIQTSVSYDTTLTQQHRNEMHDWLDRHCNAFPLPEKLRPRWTPTSEQMRALTLLGSCIISPELKSLYKDLVRLTEQ